MHTCSIVSISFSSTYTIAYRFNHISSGMSSGSSGRGNSNVSIRHTESVFTT